MSNFWISCLKFHFLVRNMGFWVTLFSNSQVSHKSPTLFVTHQFVINFIIILRAKAWHMHKLKHSKLDVLVIGPWFDGKVDRTFVRVGDFTEIRDLTANIAWSASVVSSRSKRIVPSYASLRIRSFRIKHFSIGWLTTRWYTQYFGSLVRPISSERLHSGSLITFFFNKSSSMP